MLARRVTVDRVTARILGVQRTQPLKQGFAPGRRRLRLVRRSEPSEARQHQYEDKRALSGPPGSPPVTVWTRRFLWVELKAANACLQEAQ